jgi:hypothetical protein
MDREEQIENEEVQQQELERLERNAGVYDDDFVDEYAYIDQEETKEQVISDKHLNYLKSVLIAQLLLEANDELKGSKAFRQNIKYQVGKTNKLLEEVYQEGFNTVYHNNPEMCINVLNKIDGLIHKIKTATIDELVMIDALVDKYFENKDEINETQTAEFTKIE